MKYRWQNFTRPHQIKIWLFLALFIFTIFSTTLLDVRPAKADQQGKWIDKVTIVIGSTRYVDSDPWDDLDFYAGNYHSDNCYDTLSIDNMSGSGTSATLKYRKNIPGECVDNLDKPQERVTLSNEGARWVTAYQLDADSIFMPMYPNVDDQDIVQNIGTPYKVSRDGLFKRANKQSSACTDNISTDNGVDKDKCVLFLRVLKDGTFNPVAGQYSVWINTRVSEVNYTLCDGLVGPITDLCSDYEKGITFANNRNFTVPPAEAEYNLSGKTESAEESDAEAQPTCESNNGAVVIGWLICSLINALDSIINTAGGLIENMLAVNTGNFSNGTTGDNLRAAWSLFRAVASFALIGVALVMIIGQAIGGGD